MVCALPWVVLVRKLIAHDDRAMATLVAATIGPLWAIAVAAAERYRLRLVDDGPTRSGHRTPNQPGPMSWLRVRFTEAATVTPALFALPATIALADGILVVSPLLVTPGQPEMLGPRGTVTDSAQAMPYAVVGLVLLPGLLYLAGLVAGAHAALARALITGEPGDLLRVDGTRRVPDRCPGPDRGHGGGAAPFTGARTGGCSRPL